MTRIVLRYLFKYVQKYQMRRFLDQICKFNNHKYHFVHGVVFILEAANMQTWLQPGKNTSCRVDKKGSCIIFHHCDNDVQQ